MLKFIMLTFYNLVDIVSNGETANDANDEIANDANDVTDELIIDT